VLFLAVLVPLSCRAAEDTLRLVAHAVDAKAAVFALRDGALLRVRVGQTIAASGLVLERVADDLVVIRAKEGIAGQTVRWSLRLGESISPQQIAVVRNAMAPPAAEPVASRPLPAPGTNPRR